MASAPRTHPQPLAHKLGSYHYHVSRVSLCLLYLADLMSGPPPPPPRPSAAGGQLGLGSSHPAGATGAPPPPPRVMMTSAAPQQQPQPQQQQQQPGMMTMPGRTCGKARCDIIAHMYAL